MKILQCDYCCGIVIFEKLSKFAKRWLSLHIFEDA